MTDKQLNVDDYPVGTVGVIAQDTARFSMFAASVTSLRYPPGSRVQWVLGQGIADNCNRLVRGNSAEGVGDIGDWLWLLGDDHAFAPNTLLRLLDCAYRDPFADVDIVVPLCLTRQPPFTPVIFSDWTDDAHVYRNYVRLDDHLDGGLIRVHSAGSAGMLMKRHVFEKLADPWFEMGAISGEYLAEDLWFCDKARDAGFGLYADLDTKFGHITSTIVWPQKMEADEIAGTPEGYSFGFGFPEGFNIKFPVGTWIDPSEAAQEAVSESPVAEVAS